MEARTSLSRSGMTSLPSNQNPVKIDVMPVPPVAGPPPASVPPGDFCMLNLIFCLFHPLFP